MSLLPLRPLGFGEIVDGAVQLYRRNFVVFFLIALMAELPAYLLRLFLAPDLALLNGPPEGTAATMEWLGDLGSAMLTMTLVATTAFIFWSFGSVALTVAIRERDRGEEVSPGGAWRAALPHLAPALGAGGLALLGIAAVGMVAFVIGAALLAPLAATGTATTIIGMLVVLGIAILLALIWLGVTFGIFPALVFEGRGALGALGRSISLCRTGLLRVIGVIAVVLMIQMAPGIGVIALFDMGNIFANPEDVGTIGATRQWLTGTVDFVLGSLTMPFAVGSMAILFHDRRVRSEGFDLAARAEALRADAPTGR